MYPYFFVLPLQPKNGEMGTFLFDKIIFGPVNSRRLGVSLGINLLPNNSKICNFNCIYCECGLSIENPVKAKFHTRDQVYRALKTKLIEMKANNEPLTTITYAGNGEPTLHPEFIDIIEDTIILRNKYFPGIKIAVLSNATTINNPGIVKALQKIEMNILKLDSGFEETCKLLNQPKGQFSLQDTVANLVNFEGNFILQTLFIQGKYKGIDIDNTTAEELDAWLEIVKKTRPNEVMIYTIERDTPYPDLHKVPREKLLDISEIVKKQGIKTQVSG